MSRRPLDVLVRSLRRLTGGAGPDVTDRQLLDCFTRDRDESAFAALVERHGPMVLGVCRRMLADAHDADDAFQSTFLVLLRRAGTLPWSASIGPWLYQVACRVAIKARALRLRRRQRQNGMVEVPVPAADAAPLEHAELRGVLDEELQKLPARYRDPLVLCHLQGKTHEQAANELGWARGSLAYRLGQAEERLRDRLQGRGVLASATLATLGAAERSLALPPALSESTVRTGALVLAGEGAVVPGQVLQLAEGVIHAMYLRKLKWASAAVVVLAVGTFTVLWAASSSAEAPRRKPIVVDAERVKADLPAVVRGNTAFAFDLYGKLRAKDGNLFVSPYSISTALAMTSAGARNQTLEQMARVLHLPEQERLHAAFGDLLQKTRAGQGYHLSVANALWCQTDYPFLDDFLGTNETFYAARPAGLDFARRTEESRQTINAWAEKHTEGKIKELLARGILAPDTRLVLTNAIYFKGEWEQKFKKEATKEAPFQAVAGRKVLVPLMRQVGKFRFLEAAGFKALELPYAGKDVSMVLFLPHQADGLAEFEKQLTSESVAGWLGQLRAVDGLEVWLPRFKVGAEFSLGGVLSGMGMADAFDPGRADFTGIHEKGGLHIAAVVHKGIVDVNEEGTEAAGATAVVVADPKRAPEFRADHPFFFVIRDNRTASILFLGRLVQPE